MRQAFARFAGAAAERYGSLVDSWQIWNEQNSGKYYAPAPDPAAYARIVADASAAIRARDPNAEIVLGGMWGPPGAHSVTPVDAYLRRLYAVPGSKATFDAIALHPYHRTVSGVLAQIRAARRVVNRAGDRRVATWITELGWASGGPAGHRLVKSARGQAKVLSKSFRALLSYRRQWRLRGITWFSWRDTSVEASDCLWCAFSGLRTQSGAEKPAGRAFRRLAR
jgi:hypothetical protein